MSQSLAARAILSQKLLIKDHNKINGKGKFTTRLAIPATNFTSYFSKLVYLGIIRILDKEKLNYSQFTIVQASDLKNVFEELDINIDGVTIASVNSVNMYLSINSQQ